MSSIYVKLTACRGYTHRGIDYVRDRVYPVTEALADELLAQRTISGEAYFIEAPAPRRKVEPEASPRAAAARAKEKALAAKKRKTVTVGGGRRKPDVDDEDDGEEI